MGLSSEVRRSKWGMPLEVEMSSPERKEAGNWSWSSWSSSGGEEESLSRGLVVKGSDGGADGVAGRDWSWCCSVSGRIFRVTENPLSGMTGL